MVFVAPRNGDYDTPDELVNAVEAHAAAICGGGGEAGDLGLI